MKKGDQYRLVAGKRGTRGNYLEKGQRTKRRGDKVDWLKEKGIEPLEHNMHHRFSDMPPASVTARAAERSRDVSCDDGEGPDGAAAIASLFFSFVVIICFVLFLMHYTSLMDDKSIETDPNSHSRCLDNFRLWNGWPFRQRPDDPFFDPIQKNGGFHILYFVIMLCFLAGYWALCRKTSSVWGDICLFILSLLVFVVQSWLISIWGDWPAHDGISCQREFDKFRLWRGWPFSEREGHVIWGIFAFIIMFVFLFGFHLQCANVKGAWESFEIFIFILNLFLILVVMSILISRWLGL